nr:immunoglobulin heavy chain junction region [Macaca mulatta]
CANVFNGLDSW